jgi:hypothetical protein
VSDFVDFWHRVCPPLKEYDLPQYRLVIFR